MKKFFIALVLGGMVLSANAWVAMRPLVQRSANECNATYLDAIKPTREEAAGLFHEAIAQTIDAFYEIQQAEFQLDFYGRNKTLGQQAYDEIALILKAKITAATSKRDRCWKYAGGLNPSLESLNASLLQVAWNGKGLHMTPALVTKLLRQGATVDAILNKEPEVGPLNTPSEHSRRLDIPYKGALFPIIFRGAMQASGWSVSTDEFTVLDKKRRLELARQFIANIKNPTTINSRAGDQRIGPTALAFAVVEGNDDFINLLLDSGADPLLQNQAGQYHLNQSLIDLYTGKDADVIKRLTGIAIKFNRPEVSQSVDWDSVPSVSSTQNPPKSLPSTASTLVATPGSVPPALVSSYVGIIRSSLQPGQSIAAKGQINPNGQFEYLGSNGVKLQGQFDASGVQILGKGLARLPIGPSGQPLTYPNGAAESEITITAQFDGQVLRGDYRSKFENGTFALCVPSAQSNPLCIDEPPNPIGSLLRGIGGLLGGALR